MIYRGASFRANKSSVLVASILSVFVAGPLGAVAHQYFVELDVTGATWTDAVTNPPNATRVAGTSVPLVNGG
jgi:hypothetical protein